MRSTRSARLLQRRTGESRRCLRRLAAPLLRAFHQQAARRSTSCSRQTATTRCSESGVRACWTPARRCSAPRNIRANCETTSCSEQILDLIIAIAKIRENSSYVEPLLDAALDGFRPLRRERLSALPVSSSDPQVDRAAYESSSRASAARTPSRGLSGGSTPRIPAPPTR